MAFPWWFLTLYRKPLTFLVILLLVPLVAICGWLYVANERQWRIREGQDLLVAARLASRIIQEELSRTHEIEEAIASRPAFIEAVKRQNPTALASYLQILSDLTPMIDRVMVTDLAGSSLAELTMDSSGGPRALPPQDAPGNPHPSWLQPISGVYLRDHGSGEKVVGVSSPIRDGEEVVGVLQVQYRLQEISRWLEKVRIEPSGFLYVVDHQGRLVAYPFQLLPGHPKDVSEWAPVSYEAAAQGEVIRFDQGTPSRPWTAAVVAVEPFGWRVIAQQPDAAMLKPFHQLVGSFATLVAMLAGLLSLLILRWAHLHRATLRLLAQQARLLSQAERRRVLAMIRRAERATRRPSRGD